MDTGLFVRSLGCVKTIGACGWGSETDVREGVDVVDGVEVRGAVGCVGEMQEGKGAIVL